MKNKLVLRLAAVLAAALLIAALAGVACFAAEGDNYIRHTVTSGETLSQIAKKYGVTISEIVELNSITNIDFITAGTVLLIPVAETEPAETEPAETEPPVTEPAVTEPATETEAQTTSAMGQTTVETTAAGQTLPSADEQAVPSGESDGGYSTMIASFDTKISLTFVNTDIRDALSAFAFNMGYNIIYKGAPTQITMSMKDVTIGEALDYMMKLTDLTYIISDNTIIVGSKGDLQSAFQEESQITEFTLTYVSATTLMEQIDTFGISVNATLSGGDEYRFVAQGLPADLARVRSLISMVDRRENATGGTTTASSAFYSIELANITASDFQRILSSASLPSGVILSSRPNTLYIFALPTEYSTIKSIKSIVDVKTPVSASAEQETIVEKSLKYVTVDLIEAQIKANSNVTIIKISTNKSKLWLKGYAKGIQDAQKIITLLDTAENAAITEAQLIEKFTPVTTEYITAARLKETLSELSVDAISVIYDENPKTLYIYATDDDLKVINNLLDVIDIEANAEATTEELLSLFRPVTCDNITAEQFNTVLASMSLPTGIIFDDNPKTLYVYASEADLAQIGDLLLIVDTPENAAKEVETGLKSVNCMYITAEQLNTMLGSMGLPTGIYFEYNPKVLYLNVTDEQMQEICEVAVYIDTLQNSKAGADSFNIYLINLIYINVDKAVEFIDQISLELDVIRLSSSQKRFWVMGEYSEYLKAKAAIASIDVSSATLTGSFHTFTLNNITAGEAKKLIDNAALTGVLTYIPNGLENGDKIVVYFPNDAYDDIQSIIEKIDSDPTKYTKVIERLLEANFADDLESDPTDVGTRKTVKDHITMLSKLSGVPENYFSAYPQVVVDESNVKYIVIYLNNVTMLQYNAVMEIVEQING